ncbi:MAG: hypothetical protein GXO11_02910 [Epsilonproteobacteria bacterium]|nr:hypothetical protein [Campylobacterota bacterium]
MKLQYVGPKPIVDQHGVTFDKSEPDRYIFLYAVLELLEFIEGCVKLDSCSISTDGIVDISHLKGLSFGEKELVELVKKHCNDNINDILKKKESKTQQLIEELKQKVNNSSLNENDKTAWLGNINIMKDYYLQFVENEIVYECLLHVLADDIYKKKIKEIRFALGNNYGFVFSYLQGVLGEHKPPLDADMQIKVIDGKTIGHLFIRHPVTVSM